MSFTCSCNAHTNAMAIHMHDWVLKCISQHDASECNCYYYILQHTTRRKQQTAKSHWTNGNLKNCISRFGAFHCFMYIMPGILKSSSANGWWKFQMLVWAKGKHNNSVKHAFSHLRIPTKRTVTLPNMAKLGEMMWNASPRLAHLQTSSTEGAHAIL